MKGETLLKGIEIFQEKKEYTLLSIKTDIKRNLGLNGTEYLTYYCGVNNKKDEYKLQVSELTDEYIIFVYQYSCYENHNKDKNEMVILPLEHIIEITMTRG